MNPSIENDELGRGETAPSGLAVGLDFIEGLSMGDPLNVFAHAAAGLEELRVMVVDSIRRVCL